jgi:hypothetical protein
VLAGAGIADRVILPPVKKKVKETRVPYYVLARSCWGTIQPPPIETTATN